MDRRLECLPSDNVHSSIVPLDEWIFKCPLDISVRPMDEWTFECPMDIFVCPIDRRIEISVCPVNISKATTKGIVIRLIY